jgi:hypothetical protein
MCKSLDTSKGFMRRADAVRLQLPLLDRKADTSSQATAAWAAFDGPSCSGDGAAHAPDYLSDIDDDR